MRATIAAAFLAGASLLAGCRAPRPSSIERWEACVVERGRVERSSVRVTVGPGTAPVVFLHARWGDSPFVSEYSWGELMAELTGGLSGGATTTYANGAPAAAYREGGQILAFDTDRLDGSIRVVRSDARTAVLDVDVRAVAPTVDIGRRGIMPARGVITARRVSSARECW